MKDYGDPKDEYLEVGQNMRQFGNVRFSQMTLFFALTAGLLASLFQNQTLSEFAKLSLKIGGTIFTVLFWIMDVRAMVYWNHFRERGIELEKTLGFKQYTKSPATKKYFSATNAIRLLYWVILVYWVITIVFYREF